MQNGTNEKSRTVWNEIWCSIVANEFERKFLIDIQDRFECTFGQEHATCTSFRKKSSLKLHNRQLFQTLALSKSTYPIRVVQWKGNKSKCSSNKSLKITYTHFSNSFPLECYPS